MIDLQGIIRRLSDNAQAIHALVVAIPAEQAEWKPNASAWCMQQVMEHLYNEERIDFRKHLKELFSIPPQPWNHWHTAEYIPVAHCDEALDLFLAERQASLEWLEALSAPKWSAEVRTSFGPENEELALRAGDLLFSWVAHDFLHIRQINELLYAWIERQAAPYSLRYAGGW